MKWGTIAVCPDCGMPYESTQEARECLCVFGKVRLSRG